MNVKTLERCFNERIDREISNIVDTVEDRIQNAILTAIVNIVAPKIELAIRSINASSGRDVTSVTANSERGERVGINASFENASENNNTLRVPNVNDNNIVYCGFATNCLTRSLRSHHHPVSSKSDNIPARSFAVLTHRLPSSQPLAYIIGFAT